MQFPDEATRGHAEAKIDYAPSEKAESPKVSSWDSKISSAFRRKRPEDEWKELAVAMADVHRANADMKRANAEFHQKFQDLRNQIGVLLNEMTDTFRSELADIVNHAPAPASMANRRRVSLDRSQVELHSSSSCPSHSEGESTDVD